MYKEWKVTFFRWAEAERKPEDTGVDEVLGTRVRTRPR